MANKACGITKILSIDLLRLGFRRRSTMLPHICETSMRCMQVFLLLPKLNRIAHHDP